MSDLVPLASLGWQPFFQQQLTLDEWDSAVPARVLEYHRSEMRVLSEQGETVIPLQHAMPKMVVGDWLLLDEAQVFQRLLERKTLFQRKAAGTEVRSQLIAANVDTAFIVCSINDDFNLNRIERYLALVNEAGAEPVLVLSKADLVEDPTQWVREVQQANPGVMVESVNGLSKESLAALAPWMAEGATIAVLGSSGVGKSTLINTLAGKERQLTGAIRDDDSKGRHTTTSRSLLPLEQGGLMLDTPGMREIQLANSESGIDTTFAEIAELARQCRFSDCLHQSEPGCEVRRAIERGELDERRLESYLKLRREDAFNSASLAERRSADKALGKFYKRTLSESGKLKGRDS
ncbi:ribosome small subunit-dependent GTPase A [Halioglobus maricola]|uniref:Small ribosomal subunit biogenesis GTPase RsgA n=2 Tax=Halioglobus maricola TaxID=2601894 RepID=A0A5P9NPZ1_9GAMM|nr:ribosome small subunit-dependent GTPase A [Halioglobus maricola]